MDFPPDEQRLRPVMVYIARLEITRQSALGMVDRSSGCISEWFSQTVILDCVIV
jgi:hypothetical protein